MQKHLIHYAPGGGKNGPRGLANWHLDGGWDEFDRRLVQPASNITDKILIWEPLGYLGMAVEGFDRKIIEWAVMCACFGSRDRRLVALAESANDYFCELVTRGWKVYVYGGCPLYDSAVLRYRQTEQHSQTVRRMAALEQSLYYAMIPCFDKCGRADQTWERFFNQISPIEQYCVEGRLPVGSWLNKPQVGSIWEHSQRVMNTPESYIPIDELQCGFKGEIINPGDGDMDAHAAWCADNDVYAICDVTKLSKG